jgi:hypothetical protein
LSEAAFLTEMPNFRSGDNEQQVCRRQALYSNNPTSLFSAGCIRQHTVQHGISAERP